MGQARTSTLELASASSFINLLSISETTVIFGKVNNALRFLTTNTTECIYDALKLSRGLKFRFENILVIVEARS